MNPLIFAVLVTFGQAPSPAPSRMYTCTASIPPICSETPLTGVLPVEQEQIAPMKRERSFTAERIGLYATAATDILTTRLAIRNGAFEGNPIARKIVGTTPSTAKLIGLKAASVGIIELFALALRKQGHTGHARVPYWVATVLWGAASGLNLRFAW